MTRRRGPENRYELLTCTWRGHALVGTDAAEITEEDIVVVRVFDGNRWHRCLRCDGWFVVAAPDSPARTRVPAKAEIEVPARGPVLRDHYVLRLIALDRAVHVVVLSFLAFVLFTFARHDSALHHDYVTIMNDLSGTDPGESQVKGVLGYMGKAFSYSPHRLIQLGLAVSAYAVLEAVEMVGLWMAKRWAEYLTFVATSALIPVEIYELAIHPSIFKGVAFTINLAIVIYLLLAKRLFGARGGHKVERARKEAASGWDAIERATPGGFASNP